MGIKNPAAINSSCRQAFDSGEGILHGRDGEDGNSGHCLGEDIRGVVPQRIGDDAQGRLGGRIVCEKECAGQEGENISSQYASDIAFEQAVLLFAEEAGQPQSAEGERIIHQKLYGGIEFGVNHKLQQPIGEAREQSCLRAVPISDQHHKEHAEKGDGAAEGKAYGGNEFRGHHGKRQRGTGEDKLFCDGFCRGLCLGAKQDGGSHESRHKDCHGDNACGGELEDVLIPAVGCWKSKKIEHKKILLCLGKEGQHRGFPGRISRNRPCRKTGHPSPRRNAPAAADACTALRETMPYGACVLTQKRYFSACFPSPVLSGSGYEG